VTPPVALHAGYTPFRLELAEHDLPEARLFWSSAEFAEEPVPPTVLFCDGRDDELVRSEELRHGRDLYLDRLCARCHGGPVAPSAPLELLEVA
ncbi:hypothetical protein, partial [Vibrio parahaemolyticus]|uniref:hypothetical protein n=1 Tax=Vibrio parahaemolyticus TaxID=670 RepID=UPI00301D7F1F